MWNILFLFSGLAFILLLFFIFISKEHIKSVENHIFKILTIENIVMYVNEILLQFSTRNNWNDNLTIFLARLYLVCILLWFMLFSVYAFYIIFAEIITNKEKLDSLTKKSYIIHLIVGIIGTILFFILPIKIMNSNNNIYSYDLAVDLLKVFLGIALISWIFMLLINPKILKKKKYYSIYIAIILLLISVILQTISPSLLIASFIGTYICFIIP